jgi:hypothetical protein
MQKNMTSSVVIHSTFSELVETKIPSANRKYAYKSPHNYIYIWLHVAAFVKMLKNSYTLKFRSLRVSDEDVFDLLFYLQIHELT